MKNKNLKFKDLKTFLDKMTPEELEQPVVYNFKEYELSGQVGKISKNRYDLYYTGEDDPAPLYTKNQLFEDGYDKEDIEGFDIEIPKGQFVFTL